MIFTLRTINFTYLPPSKIISCIRPWPTNFSRQITCSHRNTRGKFQSLPLYLYAMQDYYCYQTKDLKLPATIPWKYQYLRQLNHKIVHQIGGDNIRTEQTGKSTLIITSAQHSNCHAACKGVQLMINMFSEYTVRDIILHNNRTLVALLLKIP